MIPELPADFYSDFDSVTKEEWLQKMTADLKGKSLTELDWAVEEGLVVGPAYTRQDIDRPLGVIQAGRVSNDWLIGEAIAIERDFGRANDEILNGLKGGVQAPILEMKDLPTADQFAKALQDVRPDYIHTGFQIAEDPEAQLAEMFIQLVEQQKVARTGLRGAINYAPGKTSVDRLRKIIAACRQSSMNFQLIEVKAEKDDPEDYTGGLAQLIDCANRYLQDMKKAGIAIESTANSLYFSVSIGLRFFADLAKLRALRILWANVLDAYGLTLPTTIHAHIRNDGENVNTNMIQSAIQGLCGVVGGANLLCIRHNTIGDQDSAFYRRMGRNVQHLLKMESFMDRVIDPGAGSYYIESLTNAFAKKAWEKFQSGISSPARQ